MRRASATLLVLSLSVSAHAEAPVSRSVFRLPVSNGHSAAMLDLDKARVSHFREHLFAAD